MADFPGMNPSGSFLPSTDPVVPPDLVDPTLMAQIKAAISTSQMNSIQSGAGTEDQKTEKMLQVMLAASAQVMKKMDKTLEGNAQLTQQAARLAVADRALGTPGIQTQQYTSGSVSSSGHTTPDGGFSEPAAPGSPLLPGVRDDYMQGTLKGHWQEGRSTTMGGLAKTVSGAFGRAFSERTSNWTVDEETKALQQKAPDGSIIQEIGANDPNYGHKLRTVARGQQLAGALTQISEGKSPLVGRLGMIAGKAAGAAGLAYTAVQQTGKFFESQNAKAADYRADFGGEGTGMFAAQDRFGEFKAGLSGFFGGIGGQRAREEYQAASALGLRGAGRDEARGFSQDLYKKYGMDTPESMQIVQQALNNGNISLKDYADSIKLVTRTAVANGKVAKDAAKELVDTQNALSKRGISGDAALTLATGAAATVAGMDRETAAAFGGAEGVAASTIDKGNIRLTAVQSGQNPLDAEYRTYFGGQVTAEQTLKTAQGSSGDVVSRMVQFFRSTSPASTVTEEQVRREAKGKTDQQDQFAQFLAWCSGLTDKAAIGLRTLSLILPRYGQNPKDATDAMRIFFSMANGSFTKELEKQTKKDRLSTSNKSKLDFKPGDVQGNYVKEIMAQNPKLSRTEAEQRAVATGNGAFGSDAEQQYLETGRSSKAIDNLLKDKTVDELHKFTGKDSDGKYWEVHDKKGKTKKVSLAEIVKSKDYSSQLANDEVKVIGENGKKARASRFTGVDVDGISGLTGAGAGGPQKVQVEFTGIAKTMLQLAGPSAADRAAQPGTGGTYETKPPPTGGG